MATLTGALQFPAIGSKARAKTRVDHRNSEEAALVRRVQAGDELAFREMVERYQSKVFSIIFGILRNHNDAEDIAQQVFSKIYFSIRNFDFRSSLLTWIYKITVNECYDYLRKKRVRRLVYESDFSQEESQKMEASGSAVDPALPVDARIRLRVLPAASTSPAALIDPPEKLDTRAISFRCPSRAGFSRPGSRTGIRPCVTSPAPSITAEADRSGTSRRFARHVPAPAQAASPRRRECRNDGTVAGSFGGNGRYAGQLHWIDAVAVDSKGNVYTGEVEDGKRIQKFVPVN